MKNPLQAFNYQGKEVRTIVNENEIWWVAKDVCNVLELSDVSKSLQRVDDDEKDTKIIRTPGGPQKMSIINEPGLYSLVLSSNKPEAKAFKRWITHEVIPSVRETGQYIGNKQSALLEKQERDMIFREEREKRLRAKELKDVAKFFSGVLSDVAMQGIAYEITTLLCNKEIIPMPQLESRFYSATDIVDEFFKNTGTKISVQRFGKLANLHNLKTEDNGHYFLSKSLHSEKQVSTWMYNEQGKQRAFALLQNSLN